MGSFWVLPPYLKKSEKIRINKAFDGVICSFYAKKFVKMSQKNEEYFVYVSRKKILYKMKNKGYHITK